MANIDVNRVEEVLDLVRPALQNDGGDVELINITEDGVVNVRLQGSCSSCAFSVMTLKHGIEQTLIREIPGVKEVVDIGAFEE